MDENGNILNAPITIETRWKPGKNYQVPVIKVAGLYFGDADLSNELWDLGSEDNGAKEDRIAEVATAVQKALYALTVKNRLGEVKQDLTRQLASSPASHPVDLEAVANDAAAEQAFERNVTPEEAKVLNQIGEDNDLPF